MSDKTEWTFYDDDGNEFSVWADSEWAARMEAKERWNGPSGEVLSGDWRIDRIDEIIQDTYDEAIWWHNQRISEGSDPRSGLRNLPYVPWDENIDGVAAMMGAYGGASGSAYNSASDGAIRRQIEPQDHTDWSRGLTCAELAIIAAVALAAVVFMAMMS